MDKDRKRERKMKWKRKRKGKKDKGRDEEIKNKRGVILTVAYRSVQVYSPVW